MKKAREATIRRGTVLEIVSGPYAGYRGIFVEPARGRRLLVEVKLRGSSIQTRLALERSQIVHRKGGNVRLQEGQIVELTCGPYQGRKAIFKGRTSTGRLLVSLFNVHGTIPSRLCVERSQIKPASANR
jgi:transcription antitermination factor NusG